MEELLECMKVVLHGPQRDGPTLREALLEIDRILLDVKKDLNPRLRHFLEKRSYTKAWEWLQEE